MAFFNQRGHVAVINRLNGVHINVSHYKNANDAFKAIEYGEVDHPVDAVRVTLDSGIRLQEMTAKEFHDWFMAGFAETK